MPVIVANSGAAARAARRLRQRTLKNAEADAVGADGADQRGETAPPGPGQLQQQQEPGVLRPQLRQLPGYPRWATASAGGSPSLTQTPGQLFGHLMSSVANLCVDEDGCAGL